LNAFWTKYESGFPPGCRLNPTVYPAGVCKRQHFASDAAYKEHNRGQVRSTIAIQEQFVASIEESEELAVAAVNKFQDAWSGNKWTGFDQKQSRSKGNDSDTCDNHWDLCPNMCQFEDMLWKDNKWSFSHVRGTIMDEYGEWMAQTNDWKRRIVLDFEGKSAEINDKEGKASLSQNELDQQEEVFLSQIQAEADRLDKLLEDIDTLTSDVKAMSNKFDKLEERTSKYYQECYRIAPCNAAPDCLLGVSAGESCADIASQATYDPELGAVASEGVHLISGSGLPPKAAMCKFDEQGNGWTVFQRRFNGSVDFNQNWAEYKSGFGKAVHPNTEGCDLGEYWLGFDYLKVITGGKASKLKVELTQFDDSFATVDYASFKVESEARKYKLSSIGGFSDDTCGATAGNAFAGHEFGGDGFTDHDQASTNHVGMAFSTPDADNDKWSGNCAAEEGSGWWFNRCSAANLNGHYYPTANYNVDQTRTGEFDDGVLWRTWTQSKFVSLKETTMMVGSGSAGPIYSCDNNDDYNYGKSAGTDYYGY
jgi:hypothetical protein